MRGWRDETIRWSLLLALICVGIPLMSGCEQPDWDNPKYISKQLEKGNSTERKLALQKLSDLPEKKKKKAVPGLVKVYEAEGPNQKKAMQMLVSMPDPAAKKAYLAEVKDNTTGYSGGAAEALGESKATETVPQLLKLYTSTGDSDIKQAILRGFQYMPDKSMIKPLTKTLKTSVDNNPIALHSYSCDILGDIAQKSPKAFDKEQIETLVRAHFLSNKKGQSVQRECSLAIQKLGAPAIPVLVKTHKGKNKAVNKLLMKYRNDSTQFPANRAKVAATQRLTSLRAKEAIDLYLEDLKKTREVPTDLPDKFIRPWLTFEAQAIDEMVLGLGDLNAKKAQGMIEDALTGEMKETWSAVIDYRSELQLRQDAAFALVRIGARDAREELMEMATDGVIKKLEQRAAALEKSDQAKPMPPLQRYQFNWMAAKAWAHLATGEQIDELKGLIEEGKSRAKKLGEKYESFMPMLELAKKCRAKGSDKKTAKCYGKAIGSEKSQVREKAAWELMHLPKKVSGPVLTEKLGTEHLGTREILTYALFHNPSKSAIAKIDKVLEKESDETAKSYKLDHYRLKLLRAWLKNHFA